MRGRQISLILKFLGSFVLLTLYLILHDPIFFVQLQTNRKHCNISSKQYKLKTIFYLCLSLFLGGRCKCQMLNQLLNSLAKKELVIQMLDGELVRLELTSLTRHYKVQLSLYVIKINLASLYIVIKKCESLRSCWHHGHRYLFVIFCMCLLVITIYLQ